MTWLTLNFDFALKCLQQHLHMESFPLYHIAVITSVSYSCYYTMLVQPLLYLLDTWQPLLYLLDTWQPLLYLLDTWQPLLYLLDTWENL